jgi:hypothetical protein
MAQTATYTDRARKIVDRVLPLLPACSAYYDPDGFIAASQRHHDRQRKFWITFAQLRAKAEGGRPYITMPKGAEHVTRGGAMYQVARELDLAA